MKKKVTIIVFLFCILSISSLAYRIESVPNNINLVVPANSCDSKTITILVSDNTKLDYDITISSRLKDIIDITQIDDYKFNLYFHPTQKNMGKIIEGILYITGSPKNTITSFSSVSYPVQIDLHVTEAQKNKDNVVNCNKKGEKVNVIPLSLDAISLLMLVLVSLGILNISARMKLKKK